MDENTVQTSTVSLIGKYVFNKLYHELRHFMEWKHFSESEPSLNQEDISDNRFYISSS